MTRYTDPFGRETILEISNCVWNNRISFVLRKERQSVAESIDIITAESIVNDLNIAIKEANRLKEKK